VRRALLAAGFCGALVAAIETRRPEEAKAEPSPFSFTVGSEAKALREQLDATRGELDLARAQMARTNQVFAYSSKYRVAADLAGDIIDIARAEGIEPDLAFRLVRVESEFHERATSPVGAVGLTQVMLPTAKYFEKGITREQLYDRRTNLRVGFRYLRALVRENHGNVKLALLVYNRGPQAVETLRSMGLDPSNGYELAVMKGYSGKGVLD